LASSGPLALTVTADQVPGVHDAFSFDVDITAFLEHEAIAESFVNRLWHLNTSDGLFLRNAPSSSVEICGR
jgi:hypothetical protein